VKVIKPKTFAPAMLAFSSAVETAAAWSSATTYALDAIVDYGESLWQSLQGTNLNRQPDTNPTWWSRIGPDNRHAMFDQQVSTAATATGTLVASVNAGTINSVAAVGLVGARLNIWQTTGASTFTSRASAATWVDFQGVVRTAAVDVRRYGHNPSTLAPTGLLIEGAATNLLVRSAELDNASWTKNRSSVTANNLADPAATTTADLVTGSGAAGGAHSVSQAVSVAASTAYTISVWARAGTATWLAIYAADGATTPGQWFNLATGAIGQTDVGMSAAAIQAYPNGWYRCSVVRTTGAGAATLTVEFAQAAGNGTTLSSETRTFHLWGAQLEAGSAATSYIETAGATASRSADVGSAATLVYAQTVNLDGTVIADWYQYFFEESVQLGDVVRINVPPYAGAQLNVSVHGSGTVEIGNLLFGTFYDLGETEFGATAGITDYSVKEVDAFGDVTFVPRGFAKRISARMELSPAQMNKVQRVLADVRATPCVWLGADDQTLYAPLIVYGWYRDFSIDIAYPTTSFVSLEIEGLT
jgi:hypothetical protein